MVSKPEIQSSTMAVVNYLKRASSFEGCAPKYEMEVHNSKKAREVDTENRSPRPPKNNNRNGKLTVTFSSKNDVFEISRRTKEEKNDMHMSKEEQQLILREISNAMRRFYCDEPQQQLGVHDDDCNNKCIEDLGLERLVEQQKSERIERVKSAIYVILQCQWQTKIFNSSKNQIETINEVWLEKHYRPFSKVSANLARSRALRDQEMAPSLFPRAIVMAR